MSPKRVSIDTHQPDEELTEKIEEHLFQSEQQNRRLAAAHASDMQALRDGLRSAAMRFADIADILEKAGHHEQVGFLRASAKRYSRLAGL